MLKLWNLYLGLTPEDDQEALKRLIGSRFSFVYPTGRGRASFRGEQENTYIIGVCNGQRSGGLGAWRTCYGRTTTKKALV